MPIIGVKLYDKDVISDDFIGFGDKDLTEINTNIVKINLIDCDKRPAGNVTL